jgi:hypothetical protein
MGLYLSERELAGLAPADEAAFRAPVPTQVVSNGEFNPWPQTPQQRRVEARIGELADTIGRKLGMDRRSFLRSSCGMAAAFLALNDVFGPVFNVAAADAADPATAAARADTLAGQFVFDDQLHFVRDDYPHAELLGLAKYAAAHWNPSMGWGNQIGHPRLQCRTVLQARPSHGARADAAGRDRPDEGGLSRRQPRAQQRGVRLRRAGRLSRSAGAALLSYHERSARNCAVFLS